MTIIINKANVAKKPWKCALHDDKNCQSSRVIYIICYKARPEPGEIAAENVTFLPKEKGIKANARKAENRVNRGKNREKQGKNIAQKLKFSAKTAVLGKKIFICG